MNELDLTIEAWLDKFEDGRLPRGDDERVEAFMLLLKTLKEQHGYEKTGLSIVRSKVLIRCTAEFIDNKKLLRWKNILEKLFNKAVIRIWPENIVTELTEEERNPTKIQIQSKSKPEEPTSDIVEEEVARRGRDIDPALLERMEKPKVVYNDDFDKLLGIDSDE